MTSVLSPDSPVLLSSRRVDLFIDLLLKRINEFAFLAFGRLRKGSSLRCDWTRGHSTCLVRTERVSGGLAEFCNLCNRRAYARFLTEILVFGFSFFLK